MSCSKLVRFNFLIPKEKTLNNKQTKFSEVTNKVSTIKAFEKKIDKTLYFYKVFHKNMIKLFNCNFKICFFYIKVDKSCLRFRIILLILWQNIFLLAQIANQWN